MHRNFSSVIVNAQAPSNINKFDIAALLHQFHVVLADLTQTALDSSDIGDLRAQMEVYQPQTVQKILVTGIIHGFEKLGRVQTELAVVATTFFPFTAARCSKFDANANIGPNTKPLTDRIN
ncbi:MAG: hypothetical protein UZ06_CHB003000718 [Chlorobi bacterium OLB6]|nr:MAG: hypothetical protein UZ06_CHB003000718 [Chlorobi bacterium OLB6]